MQKRKWSTGAWLAEAYRNLRSSLSVTIIFIVIFALVYWLSAHTEQGEVEALVRSEQRLQYEGAWAVLALSSDDGVVISSERCGALASIPEVLGTGVIVGRNTRATLGKLPFGPELTAGKVSPSLVELMTGQAPVANSVAVLGNEGAKQLGLVTGSYLTAEISRSALEISNTMVRGTVTVANLTRFGLLSDVGLWILTSETGEAESCLMEFAPWVDESVQRAVASLVTVDGRPPDFSRFVRVPQGEDSLSHRYANRTSKLLPLGSAVLGALFIFGAMTRRRAEIALYQLTGATKISAKLVVIMELILIATIAFIVALVLHLTTRSSNLDHGQIVALYSFVATIGSTALVGFIYPAGSIASAIKDK